MRKVFVKTPGGETVVHRRLRKPKRAHCAVTGEPLHGVPRERPAKLKKLPKTSRRPERPFGGVLSSKAMRMVMKSKVRDEQENKPE